MSRINYNLNLIRGIAFDVDGVLSPSTIPMGPDGVPLRMANIKDGYAIQLAIKAGFKICIISGANATNIAVRFSSLGINDIFLGCSHKLPVLQKWMKDNNLQAEEVAFAGDDIPDIPPMRSIGLPVAPRDAAPEVKAIARYITGCKGGYGVARELIEEILRLNGTWMADATAFGW